MESEKAIFTPDKSHVAMTFAKGLKVLECFLFERTPLSNADISNMTGMPISTVRRFTQTLVSLDYLKISDAERRLRPGPALFDFGLSSLYQVNIRELVSPFMYSLAAFTKGTVRLGVKKGLKIVYLDSYHCSIDYATHESNPIDAPLATTCAGRALISRLPDKEKESLMIELKKIYGGMWSTVKSYIKASEDEINTYGFSAHEEGEYGETETVSVPILAGDLGVIVFSCSIPNNKQNKTAIKNDIGPRLLYTVSAIELLLSKKSKNSEELSCCRP